MARFTGTMAGDTIEGTASADRIDGKAGNDVLRGNGGNDVITGGSGFDRLFGGGGVDRLEGDAGNDRLFGGDSRDILDGGIGDDELTGGRHLDIFRFSNAVSGNDRITDFVNGLDLIQFNVAAVDSFADLAVSETSAGDTLIAWNGGSVVLIGVQSSLIGADDFLF